MIQNFGIDTVQAYMKHVQDNAEASVRRIVGKLKDGKFVGEFDLMYKEFSDPWEQSKEIYATDNCY